MKEFGEAYIGNPKIREGLQTALTIPLGVLTNASKQPKEARDLLSVHMSNITNYVQRVEYLQPYWKRAQPIFQQTLLN